jgi:hypothetical protein
MMRALITALVRPVFMDGTLYVCIAVLVFWQMIFGGDEAAKYITPRLLFFLKFLIGSLAVGCNALKSFRSTAFADHRKEKEQTSQFLKL